MAELPPRLQKKLGDILEDCNVVTRAQVEAALAEQQRSGKLFGEALLDLGLVSEDDLGWALSAQLAVPYIDLTPEMVDLSATQLLTSEVMRRYRVLPLVRVGDALTIAVADPTNREAIREVEKATGLTVQVSIASPRRISRIMNQLFGPGERRDGRDDDLGDTLLRELVNPYLATAGDSPRRLNPLAPIFTTAFRERVHEIHIEPTREGTRVRFRRGSRLEDQPSIQRADFNAIVERLRTEIPEPAAGETFLCSGRSSGTLADQPVDVVATLLPGAWGDALVLELHRPRQKQIRLADLSLRADEIETLAALLNAPSGMIIITGPSGPAPATVLEAMCLEIDAAGRRVVAAGPDLPPLNEAVLQIRECTSPLADQLLAARFVDVVILTCGLPGPELDRALMAATRGKLVVARVIGPDAVTCLASMLEKGASRALLVRGLTAIVEASEAAPGLPVASFLPITPGLAQAIEQYSTLDRIDVAARSGGFLSLFEPRAGKGSAASSPVSSSGPDDSRKAA